jgi:hypothetical protein
MNAGARPTHYPADAAALLDWWKPIQAWSQAYGKMPAGRLTGTELEVLAAHIRGQAAG